MAVNWNRKRYTKEQLAQAVLESKSWRQVAVKLNLNPDAGGIYYSIKAAVKDLGLSTDHFTGQGWNVDNKHDLSSFNLIPLSEVLVKDSTYLNTSSLKKRLLQEGLLESRCYAPFCPLSDPSINPFTGEETPLKYALDHIDGDRTNNNIENLRLLCYHCHGETDTWCTKNKKRYSAKSNRLSRTICPSCKDNKKLARSKECRECEFKSRKGKTKANTEKINWPDDQSLLKMVKESNYSKIARELGVSDTAIRKRLKNKDLI